MAVQKARLVMIYKEMDMLRILVIGMMLVLVGCANDAPLGQSVTLVKQDQTYNPQATNENLSVVPDGTGERMQVGYDRYVGKTDDSLSGTSSQVLESFN